MIEPGIFGFEYPLIAAAGLAAALITFLLGRRMKNVFDVSFPLGPPGGISFKPPLNVKLLVRFLRFIECGGVLLLIFAAGGPLIKSSETFWLNRGADILFVVDISPSMAGIDMEGVSRFDAARNLIRAFAEDRPSDALGLAALGNDAGLLVPPTTDRQIFLSRLENLQIGEMGDGTALGMGLAVAALHLRNSTAPRKVVILISDGENNTGSIHPETAAALLPPLGISFWVIGLGRSGEVPIDYVDPVTRIRRTGTFDSRFNAESLKAMCGAGEGTYIAAPSAFSFGEAFARINSAEMIVRRSGSFTRSRSAQVPLIIAALIFIMPAVFIRRLFLGALL